MANNRAIAYLDAEDQSGPAFASFQRSLDKLGTSARNVGSMVAGAISIGALGAAARSVVTAAREAEQSEARLAATLRATGNAAGFTTEELEGLNAQLVTASQFDDEGIRNAQATFLKFGNIQGEVFEKGIKLSADYAALLGTDLPSAAQVVGKALQSPVEGIGALERNIGKLSYSQQTLIKDLVESGRLYEAQAEVLRILESRVGGTAAAFNTGFTKATSDAAKAFGDFLEAVGKTDLVGGRIKNTLEGFTTLMRDLKGEVEGTRTPLRNLALDLANVGKNIPGPLGILMGGVDFAAQRAEGESRRFASGRITGSTTPQEAAARAGAEAARRAAEEEAALKRSDEWLKKYREEQAASAKKAAEQEAAARRRVLEELAAFEKQQADKLWQYEYDGFAAVIKAENELIRDQIALRQKFVDMADPGARFDRQAAELGALQKTDQALDPEVADALLFQIQDQARRARGEVATVVEELRTADDVTRELGLTFSSAFEDAIVAGEKFSEVLKGIAMDVARIVARKTVTEPIAKSVSGLFNNFDFSKILDFFTPRAEGGPVSAGGAYLVGERGPELFVPQRSGTIVPNGATGGTYYIDARGADQAAIARLEQTIRGLNGSIEARAVAAVQGARMRNPSLLGA